MTRQELVDQVADRAGLNKKDAGNAVNAVVDSIKDALGKGESVSLVGFGTFDIKERGARTGRNPRTKEPIEIAARKSPVFRPGKALKDSLI
jgi:DNA-binding protein HU-beta